MGHLTVSYGTGINASDESCTRPGAQASRAVGSAIVASCSLSHTMQPIWLAWRPG